MRESLRRLIPSMFHRRLFMLAAMVATVITTMSLQLAWLTLSPASASDRRARAESVLQRRTFIPSVRGRILDRHRRVLAYDRATYDVAVHYELITERWAYRRARQHAWRENRFRWRELDDAAREELISRYMPAYVEQTDALWRELATLMELDVSELDERRASVVRRVQGVRTDVWLHRLRQRSEVEDEPVRLADVAIDIAEQREHHALLQDIPPAARLEVERQTAIHADQRDSVWSMVRVVDASQRTYPAESMTVRLDRTTLPLTLKQDQPVEVTVEGVGIHVLGGMRRIWKEDVDRRPFWTRQGGVVDFGGYRPGDLTGSWGIELAQEDWLRGFRGERIRNLETGEEAIRPNKPGRHVVLSMDIHLQARLQALMSDDPAVGLMRRQAWHAGALSGPEGQPLHGAAVVLDVEQGQVLASVSAPGFSREQMRDRPGSYWLGLEAQEMRQRTNRVVAGVYQPGSTVKPLVHAATVSEGLMAPGEQIDCAGMFNPRRPNIMQCWIWKQFNRTHGPLNAAQAIQQSCNIFFYEQGNRLRARRLVEWYSLFGFGERTGSGLHEEGSGLLPDLSRAGEPNAPGFASWDAIFMAIGQGPISVTPLQMAGAYATLARDGYHNSPTFILGADGDHQRRSTDLHLNPAALDEAREGLFMSANTDRGTTHHITHEGRRENVFNIEGVKVMAKSGTAQASPLRVDSDGDDRITVNDRIVREGDHAWTVLMAQRAGSPRPNFVVVVMVEFGGSGGRTAGPIANQILHALRAEGYL